MSAKAVRATARLEISENQRAALSGELLFSTAGSLLAQGTAAIREGRINAIDLSAVHAGDSAGLALLIEWLSVAHVASKELTYANIPTQLHQLAALSDLDPLLVGTTPTGELRLAISRPTTP